MPIDLSAYDIAIGDFVEMVVKLNAMKQAIQDGVNSNEVSVDGRLDDQDAIVAALSGAITSGVTFKGTHSAAGGVYPTSPTPANGDYWIISAAGTVSNIYYNVGDAIIYYSSSWIRIPANPSMKEINPLARAVRVAMTAGSSTGIVAASNAQLNFGVSNFSIHWEGSLPDWSVSTFFASKNNNTSTPGYNLQNQADKTLRLLLRDGSTTKTIVSTQSHAIANGSSAKITVSVQRETTLVAGSVVFYVDGVQLGSAVSISAGASFNIDSTVSLSINSFDTTRYASQLGVLRLYNRALSASEALSLAINGPALADMNGSQTLKNSSTATNSATRPYDTFSGASATGFSAIKIQTSLGAKTYLEGSFAVKAGNRVKVDFTSTINSGGSLTIDLFDSSSEAAQGASVAVAGGAQSVTLVATADATVKVGFSNTSGSTINYSVSGASVLLLGITLDLSAKDAQSNTGQILDSSGNKGHALLPASGATILGAPESRTRQVRWTNTWAGTHELQYIGGTNQAILPAKAKIESIVGVISGATVEDIIIGDGSDTDRYVAITTGLVAGTKIFTLTATPFTDGTNLKLTVDPDANATMAIAWTITYSVLE